MSTSLTRRERFEEKFGGGNDHFLNPNNSEDVLSFIDQECALVEEAERERVREGFNDKFRYAFGKPMDGSLELTHNNVRDFLSNDLNK